MNTLRKYLNIVASVLCVAIGTVYFIDAVLTSRTMIKLSGGKTLFLFGDDHVRKRKELYSIEELQVETLAQQIALLANDKSVKVLVEEPPKKALEDHVTVTNTKLLAAYCSDGGLPVVIKDLDFRKEYLEKGDYYLFSPQADIDYVLLCQNFKKECKGSSIETFLDTYVNKSQKIKEEEIVVCEEALRPLLDATFVKEIDDAEEDVVAVVAGYLHTMKITQAIAKIDPDAWSKRQEVGLNGQPTIIPLDTKYLSFSPDIKLKEKQSWCNLL